MMSTDVASVYWQRMRWVEVGFFFFATPFLLFPSVLLPGTVIALLLIATIWTLPIVLTRSPLLPATPFNLALILFFIAFFVGILVTADPSLTLPKTTNLLLGLTLWRMLTLWDKQRPFLPRATFLYILFGLGFTMIGILNADWVAKAPSQIDILQNIVTQRSWKVIALAGAESGIHPNQVAGAIMLYLPLLFSLGLGWLWQRPLQRHRWLILLITTLIGTITLIFTQSRSGWLGFIGGMLILILLWAILLPPTRLRKALWLGIFLAGLLGVIFILQIGPQQMRNLWDEPEQETVIGSTATISYRQAIWPMAIKAIDDFAFTGTGLGSFRHVVKRFYPINVPPDHDIGHAHNIFLQVALDIGVPGLISYLAILYVAFALCWQAACGDEGLRPYALGYLAGLIAFHIYGLTDTIALGAKPGLLFWWQLGLITTLPQITQKFV